MDSDDSGIDLEQSIPEAINGNEQALWLLIFCTWMTDLLRKLSHRESRKFKPPVDAEEIRDYIFDNVWKKIHEVKNPNCRSWKSCLRGWCKEVARTGALNINRRRVLEKKHVEAETAAHTNSKRNDGRIIVLNETDLSPEDLLIQKQEAQKKAECRKKMAMDLRRRALQTIASFEPEKAEIGRLWLKPESAKQIVKQTAKSPATVYRILHEIAEAMVAGSAPGTLPPKKSRLRTLQALIANVRPTRVDSRQSGL